MGDRPRVSSAPRRIGTVAPRKRFLIFPSRRPCRVTFVDKSRSDSISWKTALLSSARLTAGRRDHNYGFCPGVLGETSLRPDHAPRFVVGLAVVRIPGTVRFRGL